MRATSRLVDGAHEPAHPPSTTAMRRLLRAVRDLAAAEGTDEIAEVVRHAARELVDADGATFVLRDGDQCFYVEEDAIEPLWRGQRFPLHACVSGWAMEHDQAVVVPDVYADDRVPHEAYRPTFVHSLTMTPIRAGSPIGAIGTYWATEHVSSPEEVDLLQALADSTAVALESARLVSELEERVARRTAELEASTRDLAAFAHVAAHDLKAPVATIASYTRLAQEVEGANLSAEGAAALDVVERRAARMAELVDGVLAYSAAETTPIARERIDFNALVADVLSDLGATVTEANATVDVADLPVGRGAPVLLERVLQNLIANAVAYGAPGAPHVTVTGSRGPDHVSLTVTDDGAGVAEHERESIFDMFARGAAGAGTGGSGIGLAFARRVIARHGGTLVLEPSGSGRGAAFTLTLPLPADVRDEPR
jgi:signal transduction histidine kinase